LFICIYKYLLFICICKKCSAFMFGCLLLQSAHDQSLYGIATESCFKPIAVGHAMRTAGPTSGHPPECIDRFIRLLSVSRTSIISRADQSRGSQTIHTHDATVQKKSDQTSPTPCLHDCLQKLYAVSNVQALSNAVAFPSQYFLF